MSTFDDEKYNKEVKLKRVIGLYDGVLIILGTIIGSGIFITPTGVLSQLSSVSTSLIIWVVSGLISSLGKYCTKLLEVILSDILIVSILFLKVHYVSLSWLI